MNVANVKKTDRRSFEVITPYRLFRYRSNKHKPLTCWTVALPAKRSKYIFTFYFFIAIIL